MWEEKKGIIYDHLLAGDEREAERKTGCCESDTQTHFHAERINSYIRVADKSNKSILLEILQHIVHLNLRFIGLGLSVVWFTMFFDMEFLSFD